MPRRGAHAALPLALLLAAVPALSGDGVLEISQTCATSVAGCFPGDAGGGFPVEITQTETSYRLTSSLLVPDASTTAILVTPQNANVTIDLNGFTIRGVTVCTGIPVASCSPTGAGIGVHGLGAVHVRNGFVTQMGSNGVQLQYSGRVEGVRALLNGGDGINGGAGIAVRGAETTSNGGDGIDLGIEAVVTDSLANGNKVRGLRIAGGSLRGNVSSRNGEVGTPPDGRRFYLTKAVFSGATALAACAAGHHMASFWELIDPGSLRYDASIGWANADGDGPPSGRSGWVRTASISNTENCSDWSSSSGDGATAWLPFLPVAAADNAAPWMVALALCANPIPVWCIED